MTMEFISNLIDWDYWISLGALVFTLFVVLPWIGKRFS